MAIDGLTVDQVKDLTEQVIKQWSDAGAIEAHEDYSDAFTMIGVLWRGIGGRMLAAVYKDDKDNTVRDHMAMILRQEAEEVETALATLAQFGITIPSIDNI